MFWIGLTIGLIVLGIVLMNMADFIEREEADEDEYETAYYIIYK